MIRESIRKALLRVADNVCKHLIIRDGFTKDDDCFQIDLRESENELMALINKERVMEPEEQARQAGKLLGEIDMNRTTFDAFWESYKQTASTFDVSEFLNRMERKMDEE